LFVQIKTYAAERLNRQDATEGAAKKNIIYVLS